MEGPVMETGTLFTSGIKRQVKDKRISKTAKLNVSLASKIKSKIINNSSIFKISLKHNNRALAQALSRERENSRRITTEKMLLQKEVEKLNFENTFLRLKLNNLNKKLIEIKAFTNNNLKAAIEMSSLSEFHQSPFPLPTSNKKWSSKQCQLMRLPFARVPLTSHDDDDDDKEKMQYDNDISKTSSDIISSISTRQPLSTQYDSEVLFHKESNENMYCLYDSENISSTVGVFLKESHFYSDQSSKSSLMDEIRNAPFISPRTEKLSSSKVTERKKRVSFSESNNPSTDTPCVTDIDHQWISTPLLNWDNGINYHTSETNAKMQGNSQYLPGLAPASGSEPSAECMNQVQDNDDFQAQKTVYDADMDLTASETSKIFSTGNKNRSNTKPNDCGKKTLRKVKDPSSEKKREKLKRQVKNSSAVDIEEKIENGPERESFGQDDKKDSEDPTFIVNTEQLTQMNILKKITPPNDFDQDDGQNTQFNKKKKRKHITSEQEEACSFFQSSDKFQQKSKFDLGQNSLTCNESKASRQTFVIHKLEKDNLFPNHMDKEVISENLEVTGEFQTTDFSTRDNGNLYETQSILDLKKYVTDSQPAEQNESKINKKLRQKVNRKTEIISEMNHVYEDNDKDMHDSAKVNFFIQAQDDKETISENLEFSKEFQIPTLFTSDTGNLCDYQVQNMLSLQEQITSVYPVQQNESKVNKLRQKINRKTEIISEVNHLDNDKSVHCPEKDNSFLLTQKDKEITPGNLEDSNDFQISALSTKERRNLCEYKTQNVLGMKKHVYDMQPACQNDSKIDKKLRQKVNRKTEIISEINRIYDNDDEAVHDLEKGDFFSVTPKDKETISEILQVTNEFQTADHPTKDNGNLCVYDSQNMLDLKKCITDPHPAEQNEIKISKKLRQKANRKTEIISETKHLCDDSDKDVHDQESFVKNLDFKKRKSKQKLEWQGITSRYSMEINNNEKENWDEISDSYKLIKKNRKESSGKAKTILTKGKNKPISQLTDSFQTSLSLESSLKHISNEADSHSGNQIELHKNEKQSATMLNKQGDIPFVEVITEGEGQVKKVKKKTSKSMKRKTAVNPSPDIHSVMDIIPDPIQGKSADSEQADKENNLENEEIVKN
ncbi:Shugoshin-like 2 [Tupaia chinensis]|uniref:Shugoshin-like 2 n=2 Tax=Tupaia chinensis TaxID=246437 RepID=L9KIC2_TUPCH|nr:Shugoshin-like 2 [Tupaia chinensis]